MKRNIMGFNYDELNAGWTFIAFIDCNFGVYSDYADK
jgi:hypothetical protein